MSDAARSPRSISALIPLGIGALALVACSSSDATPASASASSDIIGGTDATNDVELDAVGNLRVDGEDTCSATLIAPQVVLTARHCVALPYDMREVFFLVGGVRARSVNRYEVASVLLVGMGSGGPLGGGLDAAILMLTEPVPASVAKPIPVRARTLDASDVGKTFVAVGSGITTSYGWGTTGARYKGALTLDAVRGQPMHDVFGSKEKFLDHVREREGDAFVATYSLADEDYDVTLLEEGYQVYAGARDRATTCYGDSGGAVLDHSSGAYELVAITSGTLRDGARHQCFLGGFYTSIGPDLKDALAKTNGTKPSWLPCDALPSDPSPFPSARRTTCVGDVLYTCPNEYTSNTDYARMERCSQSGQRCGVREHDGRAACLAP